MCGIAGYIEQNSGERAVSAVRKMIGALTRRGPDGEGIEQWSDAVLGHRRLAIIDLSEAGRQPMLSEDRMVGVTFNGCIYNFQELRAELEQQGQRFRSQCDTEVLVRGYREWGVDRLVSRLRGMFAFAIWDEARRTAYLVRDRLGVKPLLYSVHAGGLGFASTVQALRAAGLTGAVDPQAVLEYLEFGYVTEDRSIFEQVVKVPPATIVEWRDGQLSQRRYWTLPHPEESSRMTLDEAVEETEHLLIEAVRLRLISDVPIGALLSGGIDSTLVCWATAKLNANVNAFTVATPGDASDEAPASRETAARLGVPHHVILLPQEQGGIVEDLTAAYGEPAGYESALGMLGLSAAVRSHATVLLTGDGGDDIFLGYSFHRHYLHAQKLARRLPRFAASLWRGVRPLVPANGTLRRARHFADYVTGGLGAVARAHDGLPWYRERRMFGDALGGLEINHRELPLSIDSARNLLPEFLDYQQRMWFVAEFMTKVDGATMYHSLEARSPFLDQVLWEFAAKLPLELRLRGGTLKAILREIVRRRVGLDTARRPKQGFTVPVGRWILEHWSPALESLEESSLLEKHGWIRQQQLRIAIAEARTAGFAPKQLWFLIVLEQWLRRQGSESMSAA